MAPRFLESVMSLYIWNRIAPPALPAFPSPAAPFVHILQKPPWSCQRCVHAHRHISVMTIGYTLEAWGSMIETCDRVEHHYMQQTKPVSFVVREVPRPSRDQTITQTIDLHVDFLTIHATKKQRTRGILYLARNPMRTITNECSPV